MIENIYKFLERFSISAHKFSKKVGVSNGYFSKQKKVNGAISSKIIQKILKEYPNLSPEWLIIGEGPMLRDEALLEPSAYYNKPLDIMDKIPFYDIDITPKAFSKCIDKTFTPSGFIKGFPGMDIVDFFIPLKGGIAFPPEIKEGSIIGLSKVDIPPDLSRLNTQHKYLLLTKTETMIKYLRTDQRNKHFVWCSAPNFTDFKLLREDIISIYRIVVYLNFSL